MPDCRDPVTCFRMPADLRAVLDHEARQNDRTRSAQIVRFIREGLERIEKPRRKVSPEGGGSC